MFEKYYFIVVLGLCLTACFHLFAPKETYSFAAPIAIQAYDMEDYFDNSNYVEKKSPKSSEDIMVAYGNIDDAPDLDTHFRPFMP